MNNIKLSLKLINKFTKNDLAIELHLDNDKFFDGVVNPGENLISHSVADVNKDHQLKIVLKGKTAEHTQIDSQGNIINDCLIEVADVRINEINIDQVLNELAIYTHDLNGTDVVKDYKFFGTLGCNGSVVLNFSSPLYIWLLEHM